MDAEFDRFWLSKKEQVEWKMLFILSCNNGKNQEIWIFNTNIEVFKTQNRI